MPGWDNAPMGDADGKVRLDKWLWAARMFKTRALASEAVQGGRVHVNGQRAKPSREVRLGDTIERLARDHRRFARPAASLFADVRALFPVSRQLMVYDIIEAHMNAAIEFLDAEIAERGSADLLRCRATNRKGKACQRVPVTGSDYCPSHRYMEKLQHKRADDMLAA